MALLNESDWLPPATSTPVEPFDWAALHMLPHTHFSLPPPPPPWRTEIIVRLLLREAALWPLPQVKLLEAYEAKQRRRIHERRPGFTVSCRVPGPAKDLVLWPCSCGYWTPWRPACSAEFPPLSHAEACETRCTRCGETRMVDFPNEPGFDGRVIKRNNAVLAGPSAARVYAYAEALGIRLPSLRSVRRRKRRLG